MRKRPLLRIGQEFTHPTSGHVHRVTDVGSRTFLTIDTTSGTRTTHDTATRETTTRVVSGDEWRSYLAGPPYGVVENVWDEYDQEVLHDVEGIEWIDEPTPDTPSNPSTPRPKR